MENIKKIERCIVNDLRAQLIGGMNGDQIASFIYQICYLKYLSNNTFNEMKNQKINNLEEFVDLYKLKLEKDIKVEILCKILQGGKDDFTNCSDFIDCAFMVLNNIIAYKTCIRDMYKIIVILSDCEDIIIKNIMYLDLFEKSRNKFQTPIQICNLVNLVLNINIKDNVLDIGSSYGNFLVNVSKCCEFNGLTGVDNNLESSLICKLRLLVLNNKVDIQINDVFVNGIRNKYDKILCHFPWGARLEEKQVNFIVDNKKNLRFDWSKMRLFSSHWAFINLMLSAMKKEGKSVTIVPSGILSRKPDEMFRKDLIDAGLIEAVIKIPVLTNYTFIEQSLIVFSNGNTNVKFIDLSKQVIPKLGENSLDMGKVFEILSMFDNKSAPNNEFVNIIDNQKIKENEYSLKVENYVGRKEIKYFNPHVLSEYIKDIFRGYQMPLREQNELEAIDGNHEILMISDIENGMISKHLKRIQVDDNKYDRYLLKENDIVITSKGTRIKIAVVENIENRKIIANGNLIVIRLLQDKLNPYYLEAYLNSSDGQEILNQIQTGSIIISINPSKLMDIKISMLPIEIQEELSNKYRAQKAQIELTKNRLLELEKEQESFFENIVKSDYMRG